MKSEIFFIESSLSEKECVLLVRIDIIVISSSTTYSYLQEKLEEYFNSGKFWNFYRLLLKTNCKNLDDNPQKFSKIPLNILFERRDAQNDQNLFEKILNTPNSHSFISLIWEECEFWKNSKIITTANVFGKYLIDYVIESNDDKNLFAFLVFDFEDEISDYLEAKSSKNYFLILKNDQYHAKTGQTLFQKMYSIIRTNANQEKICLKIMEHLLNEMERITDIKSETAIDEIFKMEDENQKDKILSLLVKFWEPFSKIDEEYKNSLPPFHKATMVLKENKVNEFCVFFAEYLETLQFQSQLSEKELIEKVTKECNSLIQFALENDHIKVIEIIMESDLIDPNKIHIKNEISYGREIVQYFMIKMLDKGYFIGNNDVAFSEWITSSVFEKFLDTRVKPDGKM